MNLRLIKFLYFISGFCMAALCVFLVVMFRPNWVTSKLNSGENKVSYTKVLVVRNELNSQDNYREIDFSSDQWKIFTAEYDKGVKDDAEWIKNPWSIVFKAAGFPNDEYGNPSYLNVFYPQDNIAIAILYDQGHGDTASAEEWRVDLKRENNVWKIIWFGYRQRCARNLDHAWTKDLCP